ncbi:MAG TPA: ATP-binding cassette domain-containing protein [Chthoniobacterales bacterium]
MEIERLSKSYNSVHVLREVALALNLNEHVILAGPSGGGKSTLLRIVAGLDAPSAGSVRIDGITVADSEGSRVPAHRRGIGMVFQDLGLWPNLTVADNIQLSLTATLGSRVHRRERTSEILRSCYLESVAHRLPDRLSSGEQQRVALARTLAGHPKILLLDEPFGALDRTLREDLFHLVRQICADHQITCLTVTHDVFDAWGLQAERIVVLEEGRICDDIPLNSLLHCQPSSKTLRAWQAIARNVVSISHL